MGFPDRTCCLSNNLRITPHLSAQLPTRRPPSLRPLGNLVARALGVDSANVAGQRIPRGFDHLFRMGQGISQASSRLIEFEFGEFLAVVVVVVVFSVNRRRGRAGIGRGSSGKSVDGKVVIVAPTTLFLEKFADVAI